MTLPPILYDAHHAPYQEDLPYWQSLVDRCPSPALELGCGTGRVLLPLVASGSRVWGLDRDLQMLAYLQRRLPARLAGRVPLIAADMTNFKLAQAFGLIYLPCNTLSTLSSEQRAAAYACLRRHLAPQGIFAASLPNPLLLYDLPPQSEPELEEEFIQPDSGNPVQVSSSYWLEGSQFVLNWHYDQLFPDGRVERYSVCQRQQLLAPDEWQIELQQAGFRVLAQWGDFNRQPFTPDSPHLIWEVQFS